MKRVLNVIFLSCLLASMACSDASRSSNEKPVSTEQLKPQHDETAVAQQGPRALEPAAQKSELPKTASPLGLIRLAGLLGIVAGLCLKALRKTLL